MKRRKLGLNQKVHADLPLKKGSAREGGVRQGNVRDRVYRWVRKIPKGKVMTYGQISALLHNRISAQAVGWMMHSSPKDIPWQRVVNASGGCCTDRLPNFPIVIEKHLLESEGIVFRSEE